MNILVIGKAKTGTTVISKTIAGRLPGEVRYFMEPKDIDFFQNPRTVEYLDTTQNNHVVKIIHEHWSRQKKLLIDIVNNKTAFKFDKRIFIVRDLRDELISRLLYYPYALNSQNPDYEKIWQWIEVLNHKEKAPGEISCIELFRKLGEIFAVDGLDIIRGSVRVSKAYRDFLENVEQPHFVVKYEEFMANRLGGLSDYMGINLERNEDEQRETGDEVLNTVKRSAAFNNWKTFFTNEDIAWFKPEVDDILSYFDYSDWTLTPVEKLEAEHYSGYTKRIFNLSHG